MKTSRVSVANRREFGVKFNRRLAPAARTVIAAAFVLLIHAAGAAPAQGEHGIASTAHPLATSAAIDAMRRGGNAVDAAVAAALTLGVVDGSNSGIGGGCFILLRTAGGECLAIDGRETAPAAASREMFLRDGKADTRLSQAGPLATATPGALAAYEFVLSRHGKLPLKTHLLAAAEIAEGGFRIDARYSARIKTVAEELARFESTRLIFLKGDGQPLAEGDLLTQPDLARTYRRIAEQGIGWFYDGPFAEATAHWMQENGGILTAEDFKRYRVEVREPVRSTYRGREIVSFPPPSSGGVHLLQMLNLLEHFDLRALGHNSPDTIHVVAEAMKLAFADRAHWLGDPAFTPVPRGLISKDYAKSLAGRIRTEQATVVPGHGTPDRAAEDVFKHTTHLCTADAEGNWVALTVTINTSFGSKVVVPGTGVLLNNEMDDFALQPGVPNAFNLVGGEANAVAAGKRPLSSMSPTIVFQDGQPILAAGASGGPTIISQTLLALINVLDFGMDVEAAVASPRFHHQWKPDELRIETSIAAEVREALRLRGHTLSEVPAFGGCQAVARHADGSTLTGAADPRIGGAAAGW
ncbi:MAG: gamma-glutamyltranspeptidase / glutathione hydrolase [Chthoniobacter sp.]|jgi:gamma-glutamyltranspeptidase/glutathione hydrolase|nr:gamma-glutamyltranspeptidase / glutathione hydrolase [Chthoniobacter sp.]